MNRRQFIKKGSLWIPAVGILTRQAVKAQLVGPASIIAIAGNGGNTLIQSVCGNPAFVGFQSSNAGGGPTTSATQTITRTIVAGNLLVAGTTWHNAVVTVTVTDAAGNTYSPLTLVNQSNDVLIKLFYAKNITGGTNVVVTMTLGSSQFSELYLWEFSGCNTSAPFSGEGNGVGTATSIVSADITPACSNAALVTLMSNFSNLVTTPQASWTEDADVGGNEGQHRIVSASAAYHGAGTIASSTEWAIATAAFV